MCARVRPAASSTVHACTYAGQQRALAARGMADHLDRAFYCPAIADRAVMVFYK